MSRVHRSLVWAVSSMCRAHTHTVIKYFQKVQKCWIFQFFPPQNKIITQARQGKAAVAFILPYKSFFDQVVHNNGEYK